MRYLQLVLMLNIEGHFMPLPYQYTDLTGSEAKNQTCPFIKLPLFQTGPPISPYWAESVKVFVGTHDADLDEENAIFHSQPTNAIEVMYEYLHETSLLTFITSFLFLYHIFKLVFLCFY